MLLYRHRDDLRDWMRAMRFDLFIRFRRGIVFLAVLAALHVACGTDDPAVVAEPYDDTALTSYGIAVEPELADVLALLDRPDERFVMVNLLVYRETADGTEYEGLSGEEAYAIYIEGLAEAQVAIGSRLIWSGEVAAQAVGSSEPTFMSVGLLEYASPSAFLDFAQQPGDAPEARAAGLLGQWLIAATTLEEGAGAELTGSPTSPDAEVLGRTGLSEAQQSVIAEVGASAPVYLVELLRFVDETGESAQPWRQAWATAVDDVGGALVWRGRLDRVVIGAADPPFHHMEVTAFPSAAALAEALAHPQVVAESAIRREQLEVHWMYLTTGSPDVGF